MVLERRKRNIYCRFFCGKFTNSGGLCLLANSKFSSFNNLHLLSYVFFFCESPGALNGFLQFYSEQSI